MIGRIYKIVSNGKAYYGSTTKELNKRLYQHKAMYKLYLKGGCRRYASFDIINNDDIRIELVEEFNCNDKHELRNKEKLYIKNSSDAINRNIPNRNKQEYYIDNINKYRQYYIANRQKLLAYQNQYNKKKQNKSNK